MLTLPGLHIQGDFIHSTLLIEGYITIILHPKVPLLIQYSCFESHGNIFSEFSMWNEEGGTLLFLSSVEEPEGSRSWDSLLKDNDGETDTVKRCRRGQFLLL